MINKNDINALYKSAINYARKVRKNPLDFDDRPYVNLYEKTYELLHKDSLYNDDLVVFCINESLTNDYMKMNLPADAGDQMISTIRTTLMNNCKKQFILVPLPGAILKKEIRTPRRYVTILVGSEEEKINRIARLIGAKKHVIRASALHTKRVKSESFFEHPLAMITLKDIDGNVINSGKEIGCSLMNVIKLLAIVYRKENILIEHRCLLEVNKQIAMLNEDGRILCHRPLYSEKQCKYDLSFLLELKYRKLFDALIEQFVIAKNPDDLNTRFANAIELFARSLEQYENNHDITLSLMLLFSAAESLLTVDKNEKRLRLSVIWPKIVFVDGHSQKQLYDVIDEMYGQRNNFVHKGELINGRLITNLKTLHIMLAQLLLLYIDKNKWFDSTSVQNSNKQWDAFINKVFLEAITGSM